jgi:CelD/BcsL family acetyltransferase involved in cellulose biosynthesis
VCTPAELGPAEIAQWRAWQRQDARFVSPFLSPEFAVVLGRHRPDTRVAVLEEGSKTVGFLPYHRRPLGLGLALGHGIADRQGLVHAPGLDWTPTELLARCGLSVWEFDNLLLQQRDAFQPRYAVAEPSPFIDLSVGWTHWLQAKRAASGAVKEVQRKHRKILRDFGDVTFEYDSKDPEHRKLLMRWKSEQYRRTGRFDRFARAWFVAAFSEVTALATADFEGVMSVLSVDGRPIAIQQVLHANGVLSHWFPAYDVRFRQYSPGLVCMLEFLRVAAERGVKEVDLGKGYGDYKEILKDGQHTVVEGWVERPSALATLRRWQQGPQRRLLGFVLARPRLRRLAREALKGVGRLRSRRHY